VLFWIREVYCALVFVISSFTSLFFLSISPPFPSYILPLHRPTPNWSSFLKNEVQV
jgi:hypothetical protein